MNKLICLPLRSICVLFCILLFEFSFAQITCNNVDLNVNIPTFFNQQEVIFNSEVGTVNISNFDCDPCKTGLSFNECNDRKICRTKCDLLLPENPEIIIEECERDCAIEFPNDPNSYHHCLGYCRELPYLNYNNCLLECGIIGNIRQPISEVTNIRIWYTTALTIPFFQGNPNFNMTFPVRSYDGQNLIFNLNHDFGMEPLSYCIITDTVINYNDGSCCRFINFFCANKG